MNKERQNIFNKASKKFGWDERLSNTTNITLDYVTHDGSHGNHLHCQGYSITVETIQK